MVSGAVSPGPLQQDARFVVKRPSFSSPFTLFSFQDIMSSVSAVVILMTLLLCVELINRHVADSGGPSTEQLEAIRREIAAVEEEVALLKTRIDAYNALAEKLAVSRPEQVADECRQLEFRVKTLEAELQAASAEREQLQSRERAALAELDAAQKFASLRREKIQRDAEQMRRKLERIRSGEDLVYTPAPGLGKRAWLLELSGKRWTLRSLDPPWHETVIEDSHSRLEKLKSIVRQRDPNREYFVIVVRPSAVRQFREVAEMLRAARFQIGFDLVGEDQQIFTAQEALQP
jgi:hypothetical protein